jgi:hypothetical protein
MLRHLQEADKRHTLIHNDSCHPQEPELAAITFFINRRDAYSLTDTNKTKENKVINHILHNNKYVTGIHLKSHNQSPQYTSHTQNQVGTDHIHWQRDHIYHKTIKKYLSQDSLHNT